MNYFVYKKPGEEFIKYPNLINGNWNIDKPLEKVVNDTTIIDQAMHYNIKP